MSRLKTSIRSILTCILSILLVGACMPLTMGFSAGSPQGAKTPSPAQEPPWTARVMYHFYEDDEATISDTGDYQDYESVCYYTQPIEQSEQIAIEANHRPDILPVSTDPSTFDVILDYASHSSEYHPGPRKITEEATYDPETGRIMLPLDYDQSDITVVWYLPASYGNRPYPTNVSVDKTIQGNTSHTEMTASTYALDRTLDIRLADQREADEASLRLDIQQDGVPLDQYMFVDGSVSIVATPLGGPITISITDGTQPAEERPDSSIRMLPKQDPISLIGQGIDDISAMESYSVPADREDVRSTLILNNEADNDAAIAAGWREKLHRYGFFVHFNGTVNPMFENADFYHVAEGGSITTPNGSHDFSHIRGMHFAWGECKGDVLDNGAGMPLVTGGTITLENINEVNHVLTYRYELSTCSDMSDHHKMQSIWGTFQLVDDRVGSLELQKISGNEAITAGNRCYSLDQAVYGVYEDAACNREVNRLITDATGLARLDDLPPKTYYVKELEAPLGYARDETVYEVQVDPDETARVNSTSVIDHPHYGIPELWLVKRDAETDDGSPQGAATLADGQFTISYYDGQYETADAAHASGDPLRTWVVKTDDTGRSLLSDEYLVSGDDLYRNGSGEIVVPLGTLLIQETKPPTGYQLNPEVYVRHIISQGSSEQVDGFSYPVILDQVWRGAVSIEKRDRESSLRDPLGGAVLKGTVFTVYNRNDNPIIVEGQIYQRDQAVAQIVADSEGIAQTPLEFLPYGSYAIQETEAPEGYLLSDGKSHEFSLDESMAELTLQDGESSFDQVIRGDLKFEKKDEATSLRMAGVPFRITSQTTGESHIVVTDGNGQFDSSTRRIPHSYRTNHNDTVDPQRFDGSAGCWFGGIPNTIPNDDLGAFPYDLYDIQELPCAANEGRTLIHETDVSIKVPDYTVDFGTIDNIGPYIVTHAFDFLDTDKVVDPTAEMKIIDRIGYARLTPHETYQIEGSLHYTDTGEPVLSNGEPVTGHATFTPTTRNGVVDVEFTIDAGEIGDDTQVTAFEVLLHDDQIVISHEDLANADQTITIKHVASEEPLPEDTDVTPSIEVFAKTGVDMRGLQIATLVFAMVGLGAVSIGLYRYHAHRRREK